jgi:hypothetical protein
VAFPAELDAEEARLRAATRTPGGALPATVDNRQPTVIPG